MRSYQTKLKYALYGAFAIIFLGVTSIAHAIPKVDVDSGTLVAESANGDVIPMPLVSTDVGINVTGPIARTTVHQTFQNDSDQWVEALYLFPLPENAAVDRMQLIIGDRLIEGDIKEKEEAKKTYEKAKSEGYKAALVEQDRPNLFHTSVANIPPRGEISVRIEYQQSLLWRNKSFDLRFPLAITPRFTPATQQITEEADLSDGWQMLPGERPQMLDIKNAIQSKTNIAITLAPGFEIGELVSSSHPINVTSRDSNQVMLTVGQDKSPLAPRDFVLRWAPTSLTMPKAAFFSEKHEKGSFGLVTLTPPETQAPQTFAREVIFVIDTSGSMNGYSMDAAKEALLAGINGLETGDSFNIIQFDSDASAMFSDAVEVDVKSRTQAYRYINSLTADGGTNMEAALDLALPGSASRSHRVRQVIFITDGSVGNEKALFDQIRSHLGNSRLFTVGIGSAPNSFFMKEAATAGRGTYTFVDRIDESKKAISELFKKISQPVLTNVQITGLGITDISPKFIPDLYLGEPLAFSVRMDKPVGEVQVTGRLGQVEWKKMVKVQASDNEKGIAVDWAKRSIDEWQRSYLHGISRDVAKEKITEIGLEYHLVTKYTSLVAVDKTPSRPVDVPVESNPIPNVVPEGRDLLLEVKYRGSAPATRFTFMKNLSGSQIPLAQTADGYQQTLLAGVLILLVSAFLFVLVRRYEEVRV